MGAGQVGHKSMTGKASLTTRGPRHDLPPRPSPLIGRKKDVEACQALILRGDVRLVTVTGPPGVGKTRFAIELADSVASEFDEGAVFVDLAPVRDPGLVLDAVARALGLLDHPDRPPLQRLRNHLKDRNVLLVLDNFEQVIAAATEISDLLETCPDIKMLVTSRQPLHIRWEHRHGLSPLALPTATARMDRGTLARFPATTLFVERARAAEATFSVDERNAQAVADICRKVDGLPLAVELAAAWIDALDVHEILSRLSTQQGVPAGSPRDAPERQQSVVNAIAWSYELLNEAERIVFRTFGAFAGESSLDAIEAVCAGRGFDALTPIAALVDKSLLVRIGDGETRFRMLEPIREFAEEQLAVQDDADAVRRRHAAWFLDLAQQAERYIWSEQQAAWLERIERAHDNIRAALQWCLGGRDEETGVLLVAAMHRFWFARGYIREGRRWGEIAASKHDVSAKGRALALRNLAFFLVHQGEVERALPLAEQAVEVARSVSEPALMAWILHGLALTVNAMGDQERAERLAREMLDMARRAGDVPQEIRALLNIGSALRKEGDHARARVILEEALTMTRPRNDKWLTSVVTLDLGNVLASSDSVQALGLLEESLALAYDIGHRLLIVRGLESLAAVLTTTDRAETAATLLGASESLRDAHGFASAVHATPRAAARARLGSTAYDTAYGQGELMTMGEAVALALGRSAPAQVERPQRPGGLTGREVQIVRDIARGLTNRQIAETLGVSERTVDAHVQNIRNKLGMARRAQIAAWASRHLPETTSA